MLDLVWRCDPDHKVKYVWFNTGMEYSATKEQLILLEERYDVQIERLPAIKSIPTCCREYGQPFLSKYVSENIEALQRHDFEWDSGLTLPELQEKYPTAPKYALKWWSNEYSRMFGIQRNKWLREFIIEHPPWFRISAKCCDYAKKKTIEKHKRGNHIDLDIIGVRQSEGGVRSLINTCTTISDGKCKYRPLFWYTWDDREEYEYLFNIAHSRCYTEYGLRRTGCAGCPYHQNLTEALEIIRRHEPKLYQAACHIFADSYEYTRMFNEYKQVKEL